MAYSSVMCATALKLIAYIHFIKAFLTLDLNIIYVMNKKTVCRNAHKPSFHVLQKEPEMIYLSF